MRRLAVVSLFSGAGGLDLGFAQTGLYEVVFANDILAHAVRTYSRNFGQLVAHQARCRSDGRQLILVSAQGQPS